ncbi:MAG: aminotransferase class I/II-fold pyridoxal phosphate-dependent enzyme [Deltaproteobacteria bacterium]|nr:MAG: aminotransferase class I/II-fold pyridoxal phosphate-dependent enzyme [Deltaproteobacteria bacterium]
MLKPNPAITAGKAYSVPRAQAPVDLVIDGNEGPATPREDLLALLADPEVVRRYPKAAKLEAALAARLGVGPERCIVSAGGDDLIDRVCRTFLRPGKSLVLPVPGFAMTRRYAELAGAAIVEIPWEGGAFPTEACLAVEDAGVIVLTSPNNPTGAVGAAADVRRLCEARPDALILVDAAYAEFGDRRASGRAAPQGGGETTSAASEPNPPQPEDRGDEDEDLTAVSLEYPNALVIRTLSKAWGLAGLRVGYALADAEVVGWLRACGAPYPVSGPSLALALDRVERGEEAMRRFVAIAKQERAAIEATLRGCGVDVADSQGNFAFARLGEESRSVWLRDAMAGLGIGIRAFPGRAWLQDAVRISVPGDAQATDRVCRGLRAALKPQVLLLDVDGVFADVTGSYRAAIAATAAAYGVTLTEAEVLAAKEAGDANNDWVLTERLLAERGVTVSLAEVTATFEGLVQGTDEAPGLWTREKLLVPRETLEALAARIPLAAVTGRPRLDAERFLETQGIAGLFQTVVCMEDGPAKPNPAPVLEALSRLGVSSAWMVGDTPDDARAARAAGVVPLGVRSGGVPDAALFAAGCARVVDDLTDILPLISLIAADAEEAKCAV